MKKEKKQQLKKIRDQIDNIDEKILSLLNLRAEQAKKTTKLKTDSVYDPKREKEVLGKLARKSSGALSPLAVEQVYGEILSACREAQAPIQVSFLGPEGSNTDEVAKKQFLFLRLKRAVPARALALAARNNDLALTRHNIDVTGGTSNLSIDSILSASDKIVNRFALVIGLKSNA